MKLENVLKLEELCQHHDDSYCFTKDHDSLAGLTCQKCVYGNELVERLVEKNDNYREARDLYSKLTKELLEVCKKYIEAHDGIVSGIVDRKNRIVNLMRQAIAKAEGKG